MPRRRSSPLNRASVNVCFSTTTVLIPVSALCTPVFRPGIPNKDLLPHLYGTPESKEEKKRLADSHHIQTSSSAGPQAHTKTSSYASLRPYTKRSHYNNGTSSNIYPINTKTYGVGSMKSLQNLKKLTDSSTEKDMLVSSIMRLPDPAHTVRPFGAGIITRRVCGLPE